MFKLASLQWYCSASRIQLVAKADKSSIGLCSNHYRSSKKRSCYRGKASQHATQIESLASGALALQASLFRAAFRQLRSSARGMKPFLPLWIRHLVAPMWLLRLMTIWCDRPSMNNPRAVSLFEFWSASDLCKQSAMIFNVFGHLQWQVIEDPVLVPPAFRNCDGYICHKDLYLCLSQLGQDVSEEDLQKLVQKAHHIKSSCFWMFLVL